MKIFGSRVPDSEENPLYRKLGGEKKEPALPKAGNKKYTKELEDLNRAVNTNKERCVKVSFLKCARNNGLGRKLPFSKTGPAGRKTYSKVYWRNATAGR